jgi:hypothetical protein
MIRLAPKRNAVQHSNIENGSDLAAVHEPKRLIPCDAFLLGLHMLAYFDVAALTLERAITNLPSHV